jgi:molybdopterin-biosynthesis enzyme MoeA-like protein
VDEGGLQSWVESRRQQRLQREHLLHCSEVAGDGAEVRPEALHGAGRAEDGPKLAGRVADTNADWLSSRLRLEGFPVSLRITVGDDEAAITHALREALAAAQVVVVGGGIGPTKDDVTREGVAKGLGVPLVPHAGALELVRANYSKRGMAVPAGSEVQALMPEGSRPIPNR